MMDESGCSPGASDVASLEVWMDDGSSSPLLLRLLQLIAIRLFRFYTHTGKRRVLHWSR